MSYTKTVDTADIARMLGLSREHVTDRLTKRPDFPRPVINISSRTRKWSERDVLAFVQGKHHSRAATSSADSR